MHAAFSSTASAYHYIHLLYINWSRKKGKGKKKRVRKVKGEYQEKEAYSRSLGATDRLDIPDCQFQTLSLSFPHHSQASRSLQKMMRKEIKNNI